MPCPALAEIQKLYAKLRPIHRESHPGYDDAWEELFEEAIIATKAKMNSGVPLGECYAFLSKEVEAIHKGFIMALVNGRNGKALYLHTTTGGGGRTRITEDWLEAVRHYMGRMQ